ncbi:MAG TPA: VIT domain-containing protein [Caldimonas sp.]|nr:VIT domain-containing protein [Caldimonas sp.]
MPFSLHCVAARRLVRFLAARRPLRALVGAASMTGALASAQLAPPVSAPLPTSMGPPVSTWRGPTLQVQGADQPVRLASLQVDVEVAGGAAETRVQMVFFNPNNRILEGKLQFPLAPGQVVSGFALDVDGRLRAAVPVEKARAQQVFEDISRRRVDPGLLQTTLGNNYELRVYPLLPGKTRTVELRIVEPAASRLQVPLAYADRVDALSVSLRVPGAVAAPEVVAARALGLRFEREPSGGFVARTTRNDTALPREPIALRLPALGQAAAIATGERDGQSYFTLELPIAQRSSPRPLPRRVQLVWDASGSGAHRQLDRELALLDAYFAAVRDTTVNLVRVADVAAAPIRFDVRGGDWSALRRTLETTVYDGASNLGAVRHDGVSAEALWFTDGLANYGAPWRLAFAVPVYAISSAASGDPAALQALADATGGRSIDLATATRQGAADALLRRGTDVAGVSALGARELVVQSQSAAAGRLVVAGVLSAADAEVTVRLRDASGAITTRVVAVRAGRHPSRLAAVQWARLTLASLEGEARTNKVRVREIGKRFGLATRETSLIVLELVDDYVRHEIEPPTELRAAYDRAAASVVKRRVDGDAARLAQVIRRFEARAAWWNRDFPKGDMPAPLQISKAQASATAIGALVAPLEERRRRTDNTPMREAAKDDDRGAVRQPLPAAVAAAPAPSGFAGKNETDALARAKKSVGNDSEATTTISTAVTPAAGASAAIRRLQAARPDDWARIYFDERSANEASVGFFLDAAEFFLAKNDRDHRAFGLRALSNLAELDLQNRQVLRLLAYRLQQAGEVEAALPVLERVVELAPNEPQSHRDFGLALAEAGQAQAAVDRLYTVVTGAWDARFADIDLIALTELNAVVDKSRRDGRPVDVGAIDKRLLRSMPLDVRVVLAWDADNTDVDLHVVDANGEEVYYGHNLSYQGGTITRDATGGYGPEEFALRIAKPGKYRVEANFFGHRQQVLTTGTGLMMWLSSGFGTPAQQDRRTTIRVKSERGERVVVGEFEVKATGGM